MSVKERQPEFLIANGMLEQVEDFEYEAVLCSPAGWDIALPTFSRIAS